MSQELTRSCLLSGVKVSYRRAVEAEVAVPCRETKNNLDKTKQISGGNGGLL
jgi:hypothetical protein